ncbi:MAG TPA: MYXO-CTERM sorting domain-containing protein [Polyangiaceae bacterium LLY-WYZ-15_(1-7)]|nr:hypothetical protein [Sandaracinus sp.]HJL00088.1 MYXO-CTERM sorting domain-containing protein [Polyangiaceae bacterium LLY-WYZ-15_(1-7)]MBJ73035.1 hypothetical protein [Sandaracinus sp.]HJL13325.1 MYXO-CTERM sorting domain-containing protein [Polyangiaceae bacterium LLY-WYZ-15_(1-7)]HJL27268.1 MYXO-CTERM sorting domain-containing protein [Polyangiaceae bacterium LLY-WYZ-15_(1-7)]
MRALHLPLLAVALLFAPALALADDHCRPGDEFCEQPTPPPCYRAPDDPDCNPDCHCGSPDYPSCDPFCPPGEICDPRCEAGGDPCIDEFGRDTCAPPPCYREPDNPDCNPNCHCAAPNYPSCDPLCPPGEVCDPRCDEGGDPCLNELGVDICAPPPCYRDPDDPECDATCHCGAPDYPSCDPYCTAGEICDPRCGGDDPCIDEFGRDTCAPPPCYRDPDDPECDPSCHCGAENYPECDPFCEPGAICDPSCDNSCWDEFARRDLCTPPPPEACPAEERVEVEYEGPEELVVLGNRSPTEACGTVRVAESGYYALYDADIAESCDRQRDESAYVTIENGCNPGGSPVERNALDRYVVLDSDNTPACTSDAECGAGTLCRDGTNGGRCCVPDGPIFLGTFYLKAGEPNRLCLHHWCPAWRDAIASGGDPGFVTADCSSIDSVHVRIEGRAFLCPSDELHECSFGCDDAGCLPDPCDGMSCPGAACRDGMCLDDDPCESMSCEHGCRYGRCLDEARTGRIDRDRDGFGLADDCDDTDAWVRPGAPERCDGKDDDCDGRLDESCTGGGGRAGGSGTMDGGCSAAGGGAPAASLLLMLAALLRRRREP